MSNPKFPTIDELNNRLPSNYEVIKTEEMLDSAGTVLRLAVKHDDFGIMITAAHMRGLLEQMKTEMGEFFMRTHVPLDVYPDSW